MTKLCLETKLMAHIPIILKQNPENILIICFGMGTTLRSAMIYDKINCDVVEIIPEVFECFKYFHEDGEDILSSTRVNYYADDGRNFLLMNKNKSYDIITIDPAPPIWSSGTVNLYSREFFKLCKDRLNPEGILCLWVPPEKFHEVRIIMATFKSVFPEGTVWGGTTTPGIYLIGSDEPLNIDPELFIKANNNKKLIEDLTEWGDIITKPEYLMNLYILDPEEFSTFVGLSPIITDNNPYTEFPLWRPIPGYIPIYLLYQ